MAEFEAPLLPDEVRELRGGLTQAEFARLVGVTPLTVYRWELPVDAAEARRPRKAMRVRIRRTVAAMARQADGAEAPAPPQPGVGAASGAGAVFPVLGDIAFARWQQAEAQLIELLSSNRLASPRARALGQLAMATAQLLGRDDVRGAFTTLLPVLTQAQDGALPELTAVRAHAVAALVFSWPDSRLFDPGRVRAHVRRAERIAAVDRDADLRASLRLGGLYAVFHLGDRALFERRMANYRAELEAAEQPVTRCMVDYVIALEDYLKGQITKATRRLQALADRAREIGFATIECRALSHLALLRLESAAAPGEVLALVDRCDERAGGARLEPAYHRVLLAAAHGEALVRLGRFGEAEAALERGEQVAERCSWPALDLLLAQARLFGPTGRADRLQEIADRLQRLSGGPQRLSVEACRRFALGLAAQSAGDPSAATAHFRRASELASESGTRPWLWRFAQIMAFSASVFSADRGGARETLREATRVLERAPAAWFSAFLRLFHGVYCAFEGSVAESTHHLEAAEATLRTAGDLPMAAIARRGAAMAAFMLGQPDADELLQQTEDEFASLGVAVPRAMSREVVAAMTDQLQPASGPGRAPSDHLVVLVERLAVRGVAQSSLFSELLSAAGELVDVERLWLDEVGPEGELMTTVAGDHPRGVDADASFEFGDGCGRHFQLGVCGAVSAAQRALLRGLTNVASLSLEVSALRALTTDVSGQPGAADPRGSVPDIPYIIAVSAQMRHLLRDVARLAGSRATVLITGESGSGKELLTRAIHEFSPRAKRPYVTFNCATVPRELFEGQLFGYRKGAFTGATSSHPGVIRAADHGTLFLDEIGELPPELQPKLLRFLENGEVQPLGETHPVRVDVRIVAATHRDLEEMMRQGRFREDLFYRVQVVMLSIPPLRERRDDIVALARHFIRQLTPEDETPPLLGPEAVTKLLDHSWPGNVRELRNAIERVLAFSPLPRVLTADHIDIDRGAQRDKK